MFFSTKITPIDRLGKRREGEIIEIVVYKFRFSAFCFYFPATNTVTSPHEDIANTPLDEFERWSLAPSEKDNYAQLDPGPPA